MSGEQEIYLQGIRDGVNEALDLMHKTYCSAPQSELWFASYHKMERELKDIINKTLSKKEARGDSL